MEVVAFDMAFVVVAVVVVVGAAVEKVVMVVVVALVVVVAVVVVASIEWRWIVAVVVASDNLEFIALLSTATMSLADRNITLFVGYQLLLKS